MYVKLQLPLSNTRLDGITYSIADVHGSADVGALSVGGSSQTFQPLGGFTGEGGYTAVASYDDTILLPGEPAGMVTGEYMVHATQANDQAFDGANWSLTIGQGGETFQVQPRQFLNTTVLLTSFFDGTSLDVSGIASGFNPRTFGDYSLSVTMQLVDFRDTNGNPLDWIHAPEPTLWPIFSVGILAAIIARLRRATLPPTRPARSVEGDWLPHKRVGHPARALRGFQCRLHDLRHAAATKMAEAGVPGNTMLAIMGHMSRAMLERYSHIRMRAKREAVKSLELPKVGPRLVSSTPMSKGRQSQAIFDPAMAVNE